MLGRNFIRSHTGNVLKRGIRDQAARIGAPQIQKMKFLSSTRLKAAEQRPKFQDQPKHQENVKVINNSESVFQDLPESEIHKEQSQQLVQPEPEVEEVVEPIAKPDGKSEDDRAKEAAVKRSIKTTIWQMFLVTFLGSSVLNIMRERNHIDELSDNYRTREKLMAEIITDLKNGDLTVEEVREKLEIMNVRFEFFGLPTSKFEGVEGLDKTELKKAYLKAFGEEIAKKKVEEDSVKDISEEVKLAIAKSDEKVNTKESDKEKPQLSKFI